jgi:hypothetical protein
MSPRKKEVRKLPAAPDPTPLSRQAIWAAAKRAAAGPKTRGRPKTFVCPVDASHPSRVSGKTTVCAVCHPPRPTRGRPSKPDEI